jgi:hypothetical protein
MEAPPREIHLTGIPAVLALILIVGVIVVIVLVLLWASTRCPTPLVPPSKLGAQISGGRLVLIWDAVPNISTYNVYYNNVPNPGTQTVPCYTEKEQYTLKATVKSTSFSIPAPQNVDKVCFVVTSVCNDKESPSSNLVIYNRT